MASRTLYPPIVNSYEPAFIAGSSSQLRIYFSLSSLSSFVDISKLTVHASIMRKDGVKVLNTKNDVDNGRYRATGIILNLIPQRDPSMDDNYYFVTINNNDLKSTATLSGTTYNGWIPGWIYKVQLRLSTEKYPGGETKQAEWLQKYSSSFSEWSTICYTKAISAMALKIPVFNYDSTSISNQYENDIIHTISDLNFFGSLEALIPESNEEYNYVSISLNKNDELLEESGKIFKSELSSSYFSYTFKTKLMEDVEYKIKFFYETENGYSPTHPLEFNFQKIDEAIETIDAKVITVDTNSADFDGKSTLDLEEDEGRVALKLFSTSETPYSGNVCIRRASAKDNFTYWEDIKIFTLKDELINNAAIVYDYTIESGVWYKYGVQSITTTGERGVLVEMKQPIQRIFNFSYLLGQNDQQLKLNFDNTMGSFKHQIAESKIETIGSKYPFIARNAVMGYCTFPINGLISFWMDENKTFLQNGKLDIYGYKDIVDKYEQYNLDRNILQRDFTFERDFRQMVLDFLLDGKPKLFKSPTEGNIIVRLMDVNCTPNQSLDRLIYSFTSNANEIDDDTMSNYLKYGFYNPGSYSTDLKTYGYYFGQINGTFSTTDNIFKLIYDKYDSKNQNYGGYTRRLEEIQRVRITIEDPPLKVKNSNGEIVLGNNLDVSNSREVITVYNGGIFEFDSLLKFYYKGPNYTGNDYLYLLGDADGRVNKINATIDFVYGMSSEPYVDKQISERRPVRTLGQFFEEVVPGTSIFNSIYYKYYMSGQTHFRYLSDLNNIEIEANPHTVFLIKDRTDAEPQIHEIGDTGVLRLYNINNIEQLTYVGKRYNTQGFYNESSLSNDIITSDVVVKNVYNEDITIKAAADVMVTYYCTVVEGTYKN